MTGVLVGDTKVGGTGVFGLDNGSAEGMVTLVCARQKYVVCIILSG